MKRLDLELGCLFFGISFIFCTFISLSPSLIVFFQSVAISAVFLMLRWFKIAECKKRLMRLLPTSWRVTVNQSQVFEISDRELARLQLEILNDRKIYHAQATTLLKTIGQIFSSGLKDLVLFGVLAGGVGYLVFPAKTLLVLHELVNGSLLWNVLQSAHRMLFVYVLAVTICIYAKQASFGFKNHFSMALASRLAGDNQGGTVRLDEFQKPAEEHVTDHLNPIDVLPML